MPVPSPNPTKDANGLTVVRFFTVDDPVYADVDNRPLSDLNQRDEDLYGMISGGGGEIEYVMDFIGKDHPDVEMPTYSTNNYVSNGDDLETAIGKLDLAVGENQWHPGFILASVVSIRYSPVPIIPVGFLECDGSAVDRTTYSALFREIGIAFGPGNGINTFNLPDFRGMFLRGYDNGAGIDPGRVWGSYQADRLKDHTHATQNYIKAGVASIMSWVGEDLGNGSGTSGVNPPDDGATETAPKNYAIVWIIKY